MATISKQTIIGNGFTVGLNVPSALGLDDGADGSYIIAANQIAWGNNSIFNGKKFGNTTKQLLEAIEDAITDVASKVQTSSPTETSTSGPTLTFTNYDATLQWGKSIAVAGINDDDITVKLPANPNTDTKVTSVNNHYKTTSFSALTTEGLYKIKTDAAGHIISAISFNDFIEKSKINELKQDITNFKAYILGLSSSTTSSSSTTTSSSTTSSSSTTTSSSTTSSSTTPITTEVSTEEPVTETPITSVTTGK